MEKVQVTLQISVPTAIYELVCEAAEQHTVSPEVELTIMLTDALRKRFKVRKPMGRPKNKPSAAILQELSILDERGFVHRRSDGEYVGLRPSGSNWTATAPNRLLSIPQQYLGSFVTKEEAAVVRARAIREQTRASIAEAAAIERMTENTFAVMPADPQSEDELEKKHAESMVNEFVRLDRLEHPEDYVEESDDKILTDAINLPMIPADPGTKNW